MTSGNRYYWYWKSRDVPSAFWLFVLDKAVFWDQSALVIKDDEEVQEEFEDVRGAYKELQWRLREQLDSDSRVLFIANGKSMGPWRC